jgi:hypothetical protein
VSNIAQVPERPVVIGPVGDGVRMWLPNGWGVAITGAPGEYDATAIRFTGPYGSWETEPDWAPAVAPLKYGRRPGLPSRWVGPSPVVVAAVLEQLAALDPVVPVPAPTGNGNNFLCPYPACGKLAIRDLSTLDYGPNRQSAECEGCGEPIHRYPDNVGTARAWRIGA